VRRFVDEDIPQVTELHRRVLVNAPRGTVQAAAYRKYFEDIFLRPADDGVLTSLVYERHGDICGFLGVAQRAMRFKRSPILAAVCSQFVVDPKERGLAGLQMLKACFAGPQVLSIADEAGDNARKMWEWCGGAPVLPYSIHWVRPLKPAQAVFALIGRHTRQLPCRGGLTYVAKLLDLVAGRRTSPRTGTAPIRGSREDLDEETFLAGVAEFSGRRAIGPEYTAQSVALIFGRLTGGRTDRVVRKQLVRDELGKAIGSFIYVIADDGVAEVLHVAAGNGGGRLVLDQLAVDALEHGAVAVTGRLDSELTPELSEKHSFLYRRGHWTLAYSRDADLMHALQSGDASLSRLQGEWCLRFP
jgi:hypothetical protein